MKKAMALCALLIGFGVHAQQRSHKQAHRGEAQTELSSEERATIQSKRMTLALGLDKGQQDQMVSLLKKQLDERIEMRKRTETDSQTDNVKDSEKRFERLNARLDREIAFQKDLRGILSDSQFEQWQTHRKKQMDKRQRHFRQRDLPEHSRRRG